MRIIQCRVVLAAAFAVVCMASTARATQIYTLTTLATFNGMNGANPVAGLIADGSGNLYGTTQAGGANSIDGTVFELAAGTHTLTTLSSFNGTNGALLDAGLIADASGNLYGTTEAGGANNYGTVFELAAGTHALNTLTNFNGSNGRNTRSGLIADASGNLYGTTVSGGANGDGTVFELAASTHVLTTLVSFNFTNGYDPFAGMTSDSSGNLYGTTIGGGPNNEGTAFEVAAGTHVLISLATFNGTSGYSPEAGLIADASSNLYGTTPVAGAHDDGTVFEVAAGTHALTVLASFNGTDGSSPYAGLILDANVNLYGTTEYGGAYNDGTVFELNPTTGALATLFSFDGTNGSAPIASLFADANGDLYGTTSTGGTDNAGTVFELSPVPEPSSLALGLLAFGGLAFLIRGKSGAGPLRLRGSVDRGTDYSKASCAAHCANGDVGRRGLSVYGAGCQRPGARAARCRAWHRPIYDLLRYPHARQTQQR